MQLTSYISPYDPQWPRRYEEEAARLTPVFGAALAAIHHIGSTAVPGLSAKPEIDILVVVRADEALADWTRSLLRFGYRRGGDLSQGHRFFKRDVNGVRTHKVHVCRVGHTKIVEMVAFRDHLRRHTDVRLEYQALKLKLEEQNTRGIGEYLDGKAPFIEAVISAID